MIGNGERLSRRAAISGLAAAVLPSIAKAQTRLQGDTPPLLQTNSSQFVELRPAVVAPSLRLQRLDGKIIALDEFRGKAVLISFWATWCPPCRRELPLLETLLRIVDPAKIELAAVSIDTAGKSTVEAFLKSAHVTRLHTYLDPQQRIARRADDDASTPFVLYGMPISYIVDRYGRVGGYITGLVDWTSEEGLAFLKYYMEA
jgi:thiol-disulfide isomerase/thioredoxin